MKKRRIHTTSKRGVSIRPRRKVAVARRGIYVPKRIGECETYVTETHYELEDK